MELAEEMTSARHRLLYRKKGFLGGWILCAEGVGDEEYYRKEIETCCFCIRDDGENPEEYEFRIDYAPPVAWEEGKEIVTGYYPKTEKEKTGREAGNG